MTLNNTIDSVSKEKLSIRKSLLGLVAGVGLATTPQQADAWFNVGADINVNARTVNASVYNNSNFFWECQGRVYGMIQTGAWRNSNFRFQVPPGQYRYAYLNTFGNAYFVDGRADVQCRTR